MLVWGGAITFWRTASSEGVSQLLEYLAGQLAQLSRELARRTLAFLWPFAPGLWGFAEVALASLLCSVAVLWFMNDFPGMRVAMKRYACGFVPASLLVCHWWWGNLLRIAMGLAMAVLWLLGLMLLHLVLAVKVGRQVGPLWLLLACTRLWRR